MAEFLLSDTYTRKNLQKFYEKVEMSGGYSFDHVETIKTIDLYYNSKFKTGMYDPLGARKFFFNIVKPACDIATKFIDLDTKDIRLIPTKPDTDLQIWLTQRKLKNWLRENDFGVLMNEISFNLPKYGTVVIKSKKKEWKLVNIQNLRMDPSAKCLDESDFVYDLSVMSRGEIESMKWDNLDELLAGDEQSFTIYDCYDRKGKKWTHTVKSNLFNYKDKNGGMVRGTEALINEKYEFQPSTVLFTEEVSKLPYRELHWEKIPGRWLGYGFVEYLEDNQVAMNEAENLERKGLAFKALQIWQTRDDSIGGSNMMTNAQNGDVLKIDSEITPVAKDNSDLSAFNNTRGNWNGNTERKTFTSDITTGANLPSRTPLGVANLQASLASSYFELKRENYGLFLKEFIEDDAIPAFDKDTAREDILTIVGSDKDIDKMDSAVLEILVNKGVADYAEKTGFFPSKDKKDEARQKAMATLKKNPNRYFEIPKDYYKEAEYDLEVDITGESIDVGTRSQVIQMGIQIVGTNPGVLQNPVTRALLTQLLALGGVSIVDLNLNEMQAQPQQPEQGQVAGSLSVPSPIQGMMTNTKTV